MLHCFSRFTDGARKAADRAQRQAKELQHGFVSTEHVLLGLILEGESGIAGQALSATGLSALAICEEILRMRPQSTQLNAEGELLQSPAFFGLVQYAMEESRNMNHEHVGTEHLLLGLCRMTDDVAVQILINLGVDPNRVTAETVRRIQEPV